MSPNQNTRISRLATLCAVVAGTVCLTQTAGAVPSLQFTSPNVVISQVTPGGDVAILAVRHEVDGDVVQRKAEADQVTDADANGLVTFDAGGPLTSKAIWAACDLATGQVTVGAPNNVQPSQVVVDPVVLSASVGFIEDARQSLHLLVCRPGGHAYSGASFDGATTDAGPADDGNVRLDLTNLTRVDGTPQSFGYRSVLQAGDVLVGMDPEFLTYYVTTIP